MELYEKVKLKRLCLGLSAQQVADRIGVTKQAINVYEMGRLKNPRTMEMMLCHVLNLDDFEIKPFDDDYASNKLFNELVNSDLASCYTLGTLRKMRSQINKSES